MWPPLIVVWAIWSKCAWGAFKTALWAVYFWSNRITAGCMDLRRLPGPAVYPCKHYRLFHTAAIYRICVLPWKYLKMYQIRQKQHPHSQRRDVVLSLNKSVRQLWSKEDSLAAAMTTDNETSSASARSPLTRHCNQATTMLQVISSFNHLRVMSINTRLNDHLKKVIIGMTSY